MKSRINKHVLKYIIMFLPFFTVSTYLMPEIIKRALEAYRIIVIVIAGLLFVKKRLYTKADIVFFLAHLTVMISTIIYQGAIGNQLYKLISILGFIMMFKVCFHEDAKSFLKAISVYGGLLCFLTVLTMFLYYKPGEYNGGMRSGIVFEYGRRVSGNVYLLGVDNASFFYIFTILIIICVYRLAIHDKVGFPCIALYFFMTSAFLYVGSATALVCFLFGGVLIVSCEYMRGIKRLLAKFDLKTAIFVLLVFAIFVVKFRLQYLFEFLIVNVLHKSITLTRRTAIWDVAIRMIQQRPILGIGAQSDAFNYAHFGVNHVHNIILELLYQGGIVSLLLFIGGVVLYGRRIRKYKNAKIKILLIGATIIYFINSCLDFYLSVYLPYSFFLLLEGMDTLTQLNQEALSRNKRLNAQKARMEN